MDTDIHACFQVVACKIQSVKTRQQSYYGKREVETWQKASYRTNNIVRLYDAAFNERTSQAFIYMELLRGGDLHKLMTSAASQRQMIHPFLVYHLICQVAFGLAELHGMSIIHRDLKTDNVLLTKNITPEMNRALWELTSTGTVSERLEPALSALCGILFNSKDERLAVLADFGLSRDETTAKGNVTVVGVNWNPNYSAPELVKYNQESPMADIFSYGVLVYALCATRFPAGKADMRPLSSEYAALEPLINSCLRDDPLLRPSAGWIIEQLWPLKMDAMTGVSRALRARKELRRYEAEIAR